MQRWVQDGGQIVEDLRNLPKAKTPHNKLTAQERQDIIDICNAPEYADLPPNVIVPMLADKGIYIASESTFYRVLKEHSQLKRRGGSASISRPRPKAQKAIKPNQVWSWDISYLPSITKGEHYYLYVIMDIFSRKIVGAEVFQQELGEHAADLLQHMRDVTLIDLTYFSNALIFYSKVNLCLKGLYGTHDLSCFISFMKESTFIALKAALT